MCGCGKCSYCKRAGIKPPTRKYKLTLEVDKTWFGILGQISQNQEGFVWIKVEETN